jgi:diacylglycerol kinase (ATP)
MKALVILNPSSGDDGKKAALDALHRHFNAASIGYDVVETRRRDRPADIARRGVRAGADLVIAAGGDGTVSAVAEGLIGSSIPLGIIPAGTGNLIARELQIPTDVDAAVAILADGPRVRNIDAMRIGQRCFFLNAGVGLGASVIRGTSGGSKHRFGRAAYYAAALSTVLTSRPRLLVVEVDGVAHPYRAVEVSIMNCGMLSRRFYPKGPDIRIDDGGLGVWILEMRTAWDYVRYAIGVIAGWTGSPNAHFIHARETIRIRSHIPIPVQADGDLVGSTPVSVGVLPGALAVLVAGASPLVPDLSPGGFHPM